ncbi:hypothetical protein [Corallococcus silvisoli]|uniref:hypothetical protein n=1 Tax=Corallococcus silvisoli TaxID=2697031 RepID=UPI0013777A20|nr:hypothetical protein [Corallococcus silvisoli]NBD11075.1 hypothetical protein [Corallococcus silvisoli]
MAPVLHRLFLVGVLLVMGCGGLRRSLAEEGYLRQQLYDYSYDVPLDALWGEAVAVTARAASAKEWTEGTRSAEGVRTFAVNFPGAKADSLGETGLLVRGWEAEGRSHLHIFRVSQRRPPPPSDLGSRAEDLEMKVLERFRPEDARRFQEGAKQAGQRAP